MPAAITFTSARLATRYFLIRLITVWSSSIAGLLKHKVMTSIKLLLHCPTSPSGHSSLFRLCHFIFFTSGSPSHLPLSKNFIILSFPQLIFRRYNYYPLLSWLSMSSLSWEISGRQIPPTIQVVTCKIQEYQVIFL